MYMKIMKLKLKMPFFMAFMDLHVTFMPFM